MLRAGTLLEKEPGLTAIFQGENHPYVRCILADVNDPTRQFECRVLDVGDIPVEPGQPISLEVIHVVTDRKNGKVRFDCHFIS
ncbi:MAG TPA: hypothetical protein VF458_22845 [Ktedonobacteraceae bacterium]